MCSLVVPAHELVESDVEGLRGYRICPHCHDGMRDRPSYQDRRRLNPVDYDVIGTGRVYPPGGTREFWNPSADLFSPAHIDTPQLWLRNFSIPTDVPAERWEGGLAVNGPGVAAEGSVEYAANPFATGARGLVFDLGDSFTFPLVQIQQTFTVALAFRTGPSLAGGINLLHRGIVATSRIEIIPDGSLTVAAGSSDTVLGAGSFTVSTNYILVVVRDGDGVTTARKNGTVPSGSGSPGSTLQLRVLHDPDTAAVTFAEVVIYDRVLTARELACLEHYLAGFVGIEGI